MKREETHLRTDKQKQFVQLMQELGIKDVKDSFDKPAKEKKDIWFLKG